MHFLKCWIFVAVLLLPAAIYGQDVPDFTRGDKIPKGHNHDWNLGPTGARGWIYSNKLETTQARQILITKVDPGSPADGVLKVGDVLLGCGSAPFKFDPRKEFGAAISKAESNGGALVLSRWRDGDAKNVTVKLEAIGAYSPTAPFECAKSIRVCQIKIDFRRRLQGSCRKDEDEPEQGRQDRTCAQYACASFQRQ